MDSVIFKSTMYAIQNPIICAVGALTAGAGYLLACKTYPKTTVALSVAAAAIAATQYDAIVRDTHYTAHQLFTYFQVYAYVHSLPQVIEEVPMHVDNIANSVASCCDAGTVACCVLQTEVPECLKQGFNKQSLTCVAQSLANLTPDFVDIVSNYLSKFCALGMTENCVLKGRIEECAARYEGKDNLRQAVSSFLTCSASEDAGADPVIFGWNATLLES